MLRARSDLYRLFVFRPTESYRLAPIGPWSRYLELEMVPTWIHMNLPASSRIRVNCLKNPFIAISKKHIKLLQLYFYNHINKDMGIH